MKPDRLLAALLILQIPAALATPAPVPPDASPSSARIDAAGQAPAAVSSALETAMHEARVPGAAVARIEGGRLSWTAVLGEREPGIAMTTDTVFNVASLTKPVFALMSLRLVADGRLGLDSAVSGYWLDPDIEADARHRQLTPRILLSHQSGFQNWRGDNTLAFEFTPGERHEYSGEGYEYLRRAIENRTGSTMPALMERYVLGPAAMEHTWFGWDEAVGNRFATGHRASGEPYARETFGERPHNAAASMLTTIDDYGRFAAWVANGAGLPDDLYGEMVRPQALHASPAEKFGLGWRLIQVAGQTVLSHDGRENGVRTQVFVVPETGEGLVILTASDNGELLTRPVAAATMSNGAALIDAISRDVWTYLQRMPTEQIPQIAKRLAGSPSFMSKLLHAVDAALVEPARTQGAISAEERLQAQRAVDPFVKAMLRGEVSQAQAEALVAWLIDPGAASPAWRQTLTAGQVGDWIALLDERDGGDDPRKVVEVPAARLDRYAGEYLMQSTQLPITVSRTTAGLQATAPGMPLVTLHAASTNRFFMKEDTAEFEFVTTDEGDVTGLRVIWSADRSEVAPRVD